MERIPAPRDPGDEVMPFTEGEIQALLKTARKSRYARRDTAILLVFIDTGMRAQELCNLRLEDVDFHQKKITIHEGKGKKTRAVFLGKRATKALWDYVREDDRTEQDPLFLSEKGFYLTYDGLRQMLERLGERAGVAACRAHRFRHFFAVSFLRSGGNQFSLMRLLGHSTLSVTNRYVQLAQTDVERQHREHSPADRIGRV
jgi:integrase/recombinase XerD